MALMNMPPVESAGPKISESPETVLNGTPEQKFSPKNT